MRGLFIIWCVIPFVTVYTIFLYIKGIPEHLEISSCRSISRQIIALTHKSLHSIAIHNQGPYCQWNQDEDGPNIWLDPASRCSFDPLGTNRAPRTQYTVYSVLHTPPCIMQRSGRAPCSVHRALCTIHRAAPVSDRPTGREHGESESRRVGQPVNSAAGNYIDFWQQIKSFFRGKNNISPKFSFAAVKILPSPLVG